MRKLKPRRSREENLIEHRKNTENLERTTSEPRENQNRSESEQRETVQD